MKRALATDTRHPLCPDRSRRETYFRIFTVHCSLVFFPDTLPTLSEVEGKQAIHVSFFLISDV